MLVLTPAPIATESLLGYVLRVSEVNGYETPWNVLDHAGITRREALSPLFPINKLSKVIGHKLEMLQPISYSRKLVTGPLEFQLLSHNLGQSTRARRYRFGRPAFCPKCVMEKGFIEAHWDMASVTACPRHSCNLLVSCPSCGKHINYFRKGLLICECGQHWGDVECAPVAPVVAELQNILISKMLGHPMTALKRTAMPIHHLEALPLSVLLAVIEIVGRYSTKYDNAEMNGLVGLVDTASTIFSNWPSNYGRLIEKMVDRGGGCLLKNFLSALSRASILEEEGSFLRDPVMRRLAALPTIHKKKPRTSKTSKKSPIKQKIIQKRIDLPNRKSIGQRMAAAFIGLPVSTLLSLRAAGHFKVINIPTPLRAFHLDDLKCFQAEILNKAPAIHSKVNLKNGIVSLGYVLQEFRFRTISGKANIIASILNGTLVPIGRTGDTISNILLKRPDVELFLISTRTKVEGNTVSQMDAAKYLGCDFSVISGLVSGGHITPVPGVGRTRITLESLEEFKKRYIPISSIAAGNKTSTRKLMCICKDNCIPTLQIPRNHNPKKINVQPFIDFEYKDRLSEILAKNDMDTLPSQPRPDTAMLMRQYLKGLTAKRAMLPRRAGKPNNAAIAKAAGFDRNTLYVNPKVKALLDEFDMKERSRHSTTIKDSAIKELRRYLGQLRSDKHPLPRNGGKPNMAAIARLGRFNRNIFYLNPEARSLISNFDTEDQKQLGDNIQGQCIHT